MLKQAFRSYLSALHPRNIKKLKESQNWFSIIYFLFIYPFIISSINDSPGAAKIIWFTIIKMLPFLLMIWSNISSKFLISKAMFLCPMKQEERKEYINCVLLIKIGVPVLVGIGIELIWSIFYGLHLWQIIAIAFIHFSLGIATYICFEAPGKYDQNVTMAKKDKTGKTKWAWMNIVSMILGMLLLVGLEITDMTASMTLFNGIAVGIALAILLIFDILIIITQYQSTIEEACNYEQTFRVLGKVPTNENVEFDIFK